MRPFEPLSWDELSDLAKRNLPQDASPTVKLMVARSLMPMVTRDLVGALYFLSADEDKRIRAAARKSLVDLPRELLAPVLAEKLSPKILHWFALRSLPDAKLYETITLNRETADETIAYLAATRSEESLLNIISNNQARLLRSPDILRALLNNDATPVDISERVRSFVEMTTGQPIEELLRETEPEAAAESAVTEEAAANAAALFDEETTETTSEVPAAPEAGGEKTDIDSPDLGDMVEDELPPDFDLDQLEKEVFASSEDFAADFLVEPEQELSAEQRQTMTNRIRKMTVLEKMKLGMKGNIEARQILIKSANKMVQECVLRNPGITIEEVIKMAKDKTMREDLIRVITLNKEWTKSYTVVHQLCWNPKTPLITSMKYLQRLNMRDLQSIAKSKQVPGILAIQARKLALEKERAR
ncbi:MAG: hypothetical protein GX444_07595 [Myxococcales bacterium]|nr:hypothetical protein [Myxococcales bacterium]